MPCTALSRGRFRKKTTTVRVSGLIARSGTVEASIQLFKEIFMIKSTPAVITAACLFAVVTQACAGPGSPGIFPPSSHVRALAVSAPSITNEYNVPRPNAYPLEITTGPDGALWFTERLGGAFGRITTTGAATDFVATGPARFQFGIASGSDGNLWTTGISLPNVTVQEHSNNQSPENAVFRVTPQGSSTQYALPADSFPKQIVTGPDGNVWFVERYGKIGRMTPSGQLTEFALPSDPPAGPSGITVGPDNALWFTATFGGYVGRITTSGSISTFPLPNGGGPFGIATGADGNLWIAEFFNDQIARMTPTGDVTEYALAGGSSPRGIVAAPNGKLYFAENGRGNIGEISLTGTIREFAIPTPNSGPAGVTVGPDGNVWFTESNANKIGKLTL
jgi:streptogramin lyase